MLPIEEKSNKKNHPYLKLTCIVVGALLGIMLVVFAGMVGYYLWQFKYGNPESLRELSQNFSQKFTVDPSHTETTFNTADIQKRIQPTNPTTADTQAQTTLIAFVDFDCPYSQEAYPTFKKIREKYGPAVRVVFKQLPLTSIHPNAMAKAQASACAYEQGLFWQYHDTLFENQEPFSQDLLITIAEQIGLDVPTFTYCLDQEKTKQTILEDMQDAVDIGIRGTPTYILNGTVIEGTQDEQTWDSLILSAMQHI